MTCVSTVEELDMAALTVPATPPTAAAAVAVCPAAPPAVAGVRGEGARVIADSTSVGIGTRDDCGLAPACLLKYSTYSRTIGKIPMKPPSHAGPIRAGQTGTNTSLTDSEHMNVHS